LTGDEAIDFSDFEYWERLYVEALNAVGITAKPETISVADVRKTLQRFGWQADDTTVKIAITYLIFHEDTIRYSVYRNRTIGRSLIVGSDRSKPNEPSPITPHDELVGKNLTIDEAVRLANTV